MILRADMPPRYSLPWCEPFESSVLDKLEPVQTLLDVGSGAHPAIASEERPDGIDYVGLELSKEELDAAKPGGYDETIAADAVSPLPELADRFDVGHIS